MWRPLRQFRSHLPTASSQPAPWTILAARLQEGPSDGKPLGLASDAREKQIRHADLFGVRFRLTTTATGKIVQDLAADAPTTGRRDTSVAPAPWRKRRRETAPAAGRDDRRRRGSGLGVEARPRTKAEDDPAAAVRYAARHGGSSLPRKCSPATKAASSGRHHTLICRGHRDRERARCFPLTARAT